MHAVYISYAAGDAGIASVVRDELARRGVDAHLGSEGAPGRDWFERLDEALERTSDVLVIASHLGMESDHVTFEWGTALARGARVIPLKREKELVGKLVDLIAHPFEREQPTRDDWRGLLEKLVRAWEPDLIHERREVRAAGMVRLANVHRARTDGELLDERDGLVLPVLLRAVAGLHPDTRCWAMHELVMANHREACPLLTRALSHRDPATRRSAVRALGRLGNSEATTAAVLPLLGYPPDDPPGEVVAEVARVLGSSARRDLSAPRLRRVVEAAAVPPPDAALCQALQALLQLGDEGAIPAIRSCVERLAPVWDEDDTSWDTLQAGLLALRLLGGERSVHLFGELLLRDDLFGGPSTIEPYRQVPSSQRVEPAAHLVAHLVGLGAVDALEALLAHADDARRAYAIAALVRLREEPPPDTLARCLHAGGDFGRAAAADALAAAGSAGVAELIAALDAPDDDVRAVAASRLEHPSAIDGLAALLDVETEVSVAQFATDRTQRWGVADVHHRSHLERTTLGRIAARSLRGVDPALARGAYNAWLARQNCDDWPYGPPEPI